MAKFREVLQNRNFFLLWLGQIISQIGDRLSQMALIGCIPSIAPGSSVQLAKLLSFTILPVFLIGPVAGVYVDRWDRRTTMCVSDYLRAVLILLVPLFLLSRGSLGLVYFLIFIVFSIGRFFVPSKLAIIPEIVPEKDLLISNSLVNTTGMIAAIAGFGIAGLVVEYLGPRGGFFLDAASFFISASLILFISTKRKPALKISQIGLEIVEVIRKSVLQEIKEGLVYFIKQKDVRFTGLIMFILGAAAGSVYIVGIVFIQQTLKSVTLDLGFLIMFLGLGLFLGSLAYGRFGQRIEHYKVIYISLVFSGIMLVAFAFLLQLYPGFFLAAALACGLGFFISPIFTATNTIIHEAGEQGMMGKTFSSLEIVLHLGFFIFIFVSSFLAERFSYGLILIAVGVVFGLIGLISLIFQRRIRWLN